MPDYWAERGECVNTNVCVTTTHTCPRFGVKETYAEARIYFTGHD
jgi:hypothetical protein